MVASKRAAADPTESSNENKRTCIGEGETAESLILDELCCDRGIWSELGEEVATNLSKSVVTLVLTDGHGVLFASCGVAIERRRNITRFVTEANLVRALLHGDFDVKVEVRYEGKVFIGVLEACDLEHNIAFVIAMTALDVYCVPLNPVMGWMPGTKVVAVARGVSGKLMMTIGKLGRSDRYHIYEDHDAFIMDCCQSSEVWLGGACFDFDGNFVGMNLRFTMQPGLVTLPSSTILERWEHLCMPQRLPCTFQDVKHYPFPQAYEDVPSKTQSENGSRGYPPSASRDAISRGIVLLNAHHDPFGDVYHPKEGVWGEFFDKSFPLFLSKSVVALASFNGGTKFFSCTGFFINFDDECQTILTSATLVRDPDGSNKIVEGLKIKVLLPNNQSKEGKLKHCSLQYNVALISVKNCRYVRHVNLEQCSVNFSSEVVAVGRSFESGTLMATRGERTCWSGPFDCNDLSYSTCKISKLGIGGPLVDIDGNFLGMNYYDKKMGTPFVYFDVLFGILQYFKTKKTEYRSMVGEVRHILEDNNYNPNRWILPDPSSMDEHEREEEGKALASLRKTRNCRIQYAYTDGYVTVLK